MDDKNSSRAADYCAAKKEFREGLRSLYERMQAAGINSSINVKIEALLSIATDDFVDDAGANFPEEYLGYYGYTITADRALSHWESLLFVPAGSEIKANREYSLLLRNRIRYENPQVGDQHIGIGAEYV